MTSTKLKCFYSDSSLYEFQIYPRLWLCISIELPYYENVDSEHQGNEHIILSMRN